MLTVLIGIFILGVLTSVFLCKKYKRTNVFILSIISAFILISISGCDESTLPTSSEKEAETSVNAQEQTEKEETPEKSPDTKDQKDATEKEKEQTTGEEKPAKDKEKPKNTNLSGMKVHFIDVGQADAALIQYDDRAILIDAGDWNGNEVVSYLQNQGIKKLDLMVGSHPHADHIGQMDKVMDNFDVDEVWMSGGASTSQVFERVITAIADKDIGYDEPRAGDNFKIGDLTIDVLGPSSITGNVNDDSIVMKLTYGSVSFLFTGDVETPGEGKIVSSGQNVGATILKVGHHGSDTSTTQAFLDKVDPKAAIISVAAKSKYNHPNKSVVDRLHAKNIDLYATKSHGNIVVSTDGSSYTISSSTSGTVTAGDTGQQSAKKETTTKKPVQTDKPKEKPAQKEPAKKEPSAACVDINSASEAELHAIKHISDARAPLVIKARPFNSVDDLSKVKGIAAGRLADIKAEGIACVK